jgi:predicted nucleic acid-binding protein
MPLYYVDASALVKAIRKEAAADALRTHLEEADLVTSELVLTEFPGPCAGWPRRIRDSRSNRYWRPLAG